MFFNSFEFAIFLPIVFLLYWFVVQKNRNLQNLFVLIASYVFYGWWDWRFLSLIIISSFTDYFIGLCLSSTTNENRRKALLVLSLVVNLGLLGFFKYYNFFIDNFGLLLTNIGLSPNIKSLNIILPVGISFYTFQTLSYTIDIYKGKLTPTKNIISFFAFVSFFPQLVAGPIERASNLLPQFEKSRRFEYANATDGLRQILWGLVKKIVIADTLARHVDMIFSNYENLNGSVLVLGAIYFAFQIYGDFSGYSDIAIGTARLFGFDLMRNFAYPYFSRNVAEFWKRWHISLSTWLRDFVYLNLKGSLGSKSKRIRNTLITFTLSGLWHGANWNFVFWGFLHGAYFIPLILNEKSKIPSKIVASKRMFPTIREFIQIVFTFFLTSIGWIFFRSQSLSQAFGYLARVFSIELFTLPNDHRQGLVYLFCLLIIEWIQRKKQHALEIHNFNLIIRWIIYIVLALIVIMHFDRPQTFIYFQF